MKMNFRKLISRIENVEELSPQGKVLLRELLESLNGTDLFTNKAILKGELTARIDKVEGVSAQEKELLKDMMWQLINRAGPVAIVIAMIMFVVALWYASYLLVNQIPMKHGVTPGLGGALALALGVAVWGIRIEVKIRSWFR